MIFLPSFMSEISQLQLIIGNDLNVEENMFNALTSQEKKMTRPIENKFY
jgi:hypothetical protein